MTGSTTDIRIVPLPTGQDVLTEIIREGARRMLFQADEAEVLAWIDAHAHLKGQDRRRQVVRDGHLPERTIQTGLGDVEVEQLGRRRAPQHPVGAGPAVHPGADEAARRRPRGADRDRRRLPVERAVLEGTPPGRESA